MKAGFAVADITPELGIYLTGYGHPERLAEGVHSPLTATAMVLAAGNTEVAVVSLDWCGMPTELANDMRQAIAEATGIPAENTMVCCTHTHSAPNTSSRRTLGRTDVDPEHRGEAYARRSIPVIADAVRRAKAGARSSAGKNARTESSGIMA